MKKGKKAMTIKSGDEVIEAEPDKMPMSDIEMAGVRLYRNFNKAIYDRKLIEFKEEANEIDQDLQKLYKLLAIIVREEIRFTPIVVCGYADDLLKDMFLRLIPNDVPGGLAGIVGGYGPLSDLSKRIKLAYAFENISRDLIGQFDIIRKVRNRISHDWDIEPVDCMLKSIVVNGLYPVESIINEEQPDLLSFNGQEDRSAVLRVRLIWLCGRLTYEAYLFENAKRAGLNPIEALYGDRPPLLLGKIATLCVEATQDINQ